jgi:hypothetical protein
MIYKNVEFNIVLCLIFGYNGLMVASQESQKKKLCNQAPMSRAQGAYRF